MARIYKPKWTASAFVRIVETEDGDKLLVSYETPVALLTFDGSFYRSTTRFSRTTESHIQRFWCEADYCTTVDKPQDYFDRLLKLFTGDIRLPLTRAQENALSGVLAETRVNYGAHTAPGDKNLVVPVYRRRW